MINTQKKTLFWLGLAGIVYFCIFIIPNLTGSKDANMLSVFEQDEFAEYPFVLRMLTSDLTLYQTLRYFVIYLFYYYGYPFFFFSALAILPIKWIAGADWMLHTQTIVLVLRQIINVLPGILSVGILVFLQTRFKSVWKSLVLFVFLLLIPPLVFNNLWWHPDGLLLLYCVLTLFFLDRDDFRFGRNFIFAAIFTGLATSTKIIGLFFCLTIAVYLIWGLAKKKINFKRALLAGLLFLVAMIITIVVTNPVLLLPIERQEVFAAYKSGFSQLSQGFYESSTWSTRWAAFWGEIKPSYGDWYFILFVLIVPAIGVIKNKNRVINGLILSWSIVHIVYFTFFTAVMKSYYFLPAALPLFSSLGTLFELAPGDLQLSGKQSRTKVFSMLIIVLSFMFILFQTVRFAKSDGNLILKNINREKTSINIQFFNKLDHDYLSKIPDDVNLIIYRDWRAYVQPRENWTIEYDWKFADYGYMADLKPDLIILEYENVNYFSKVNLLTNSLDLERAKLRFNFYSDASHEIITGYHLIYKDGFGYAFVSDELYLNYFK